MGTKYTYDGTTTTSGATVNNLTGSTIAYYGYVDEDPYLRVLSCTAAGTLQDITIGSGGSLVTFRCKTVVSNLLVSGNSADTVVSMSSGGPVISGLTVRGNGAKITLGGVEIYNVDIRPNSGARVTLSDSWSAAWLQGGYIESSTVTFSRGTIKDITVGPNTYVNLYGSAGTDLSIGGHFVSGRVESGGQIKIWSSGGSVASTTFNSANLYMFGAEMGIAAVNRGRAKDLVFENGAYFGNGGSSFDTKKYHSGGTATNLTFRTGATMGVYSGGYVSHVTLSGESTQITISGAARVEDVTVQSGSIIKFAGGTWKNNWNDWFTSNQFASNVTIESGGTAGMVNYAMLMDVTAVAGARITRPANLIGFGGENTNIAKGVIDNNELGADFQVVGGTATGLDLAINADGRSAFLIFSGLTVSGATVTSGGSLFLFDGANANDIDVYGSSGTKRAVISMWNATGANVSIGSGATLSIESNGAVLNGVSIFGNAYYAADKKVSGAGLVNMKGGTVSGLVISGGTMTTVQNANKKYIYNIDVTNDNNGAARTGNTDIGVLNISSGTYISGGSMYKRAQLNLRQGVVEDVHFGADTWNNIYAGGSVLGGVASNGADFRMGYGNAGALIDGMLFLGNAKVHMRDSRATVKNVVMSGNQNCQIEVSAGVVSSATLWAGALNISGGTAVSATTVTSLGSGIASDTLVRSTGKIYQSGGSMINTSIYAGGSNLYIYDDFADDGETVVSNLVMVGVGSEGSNLSSGCAWGYQYGGLVSGATIRRAAYALSGGTMTNVNFGEKTWFNASTGVVSNCGASNGGVLRGRGAEFVGVTLTDSGTIFEHSQGAANDIVLRNGASMYVSSGANVTLNGVTVSDGARLRLYNGATATNATVSAGGTMYLSGTAKVTGIAAEAGANIEIDLTGKTAGVGNFDSLANVEKVMIQNHTPTNGTYTLADEGNTALKVGIVGSRVFDGEVAAGSSYIDPLIGKTFTLNAAGTELTVAGYTRNSTGEAATFAQSGSVINGGDKELQWEKANVAGKIYLIDAANTVAGNAWLDIHTPTAANGAAVYGTAEDVDFAGKISYQLHGTGTLANVAFGANYGGSVKGVDILSYNTEYTGVGYAGGFGTVGADGVELVFASKCSLDKDFYAGALYNANKVAAGTTTSVSSIRTSFGESAGQVAPTVKGNFYGGGAVKAGTITTTENTSALQTVGDITLTLLAGTATKGAQACIFAGGYATGHDTAKLAPVYTVESVTLNVGGGDWGAAAGGRGIFGGAFASDNTAAGDNGVYAMVGDVNISITGGTMGNVYGGGWAQKKAFSRVGDVYINISGGTIANVFGGGSTSTSGGSTQADDVTITVSGGTITGDIFARGQSDTDVVNSAEVIFTGATDFACGVFGYSYVATTEQSDATLSFSGYTGTFSGEIGGFGDITVAGNSWMTLGTAADNVTNNVWIFDFNGRDLGLDGQAALSWNSADFTEDTITLKIASTRSEGWTLVSGADASKYNTAADKFLVEIDGGEAVSLTFDETTGKTDAIASGDYAGWGFAVENSVLKFKKLA